MMTPSAPAAGTVTSALTEWDLFLMLMTDPSVMCIPLKSSWLLPVVSCGRPAMSGLIRS